MVDSVKKIKWKKCNSEQKSLSNNVNLSGNSNNLNNILDIKLDKDIEKQNFIEERVECIQEKTKIHNDNKNQNKTQIQTQNNNHNTTNENNFKYQESFEGFYTDDYNILNIHYSILQNFKKEYEEKIPEYKKQINEINSKLSQTLKPIYRKNLLNDYREIESKIQQVQNKTEEKRYLDTSEYYINKYKEIGVLKKVISFKAKSQDSNFNSNSNENNENSSNEINQNEERHLIIANYLEIAREYIQVNLIRQLNNPNVCKNCKYNFEESNDDVLSCPECGVEHTNIFRVPTSSENQSGNVYKNNYTDDANFIKALKRFQGLQTNKLPESLFPELDEYFKSYGMPTGEEIRKRPLNKNNQKDGVSRELLHEALSKTKNSAFYEDDRLIMNLYWGIPLPDISGIEAGIMEDYSKTQKVFLALDKDRTSSLNANYRLFRHLQLRGYPCKESDFKLIRTQSIRELYENLWYKMCLGSGLKYISLS